MGIDKRILKARIMEIIMVGPLSEIENRIDKMLMDICFHAEITIDGSKDLFKCNKCGKNLKLGTWENL
jgi:hypothetical protein